MAQGGQQSQIRVQRESRMWKSPAFAKRAGGATVSFPDGEDNPYHIVISVPAPDKYTFGEMKDRDCPYRGQSFEVDVTVPETYPFKEPEFFFRTFPWHPRINAQGEYCGDIDWAPTKNMSDIAKIVIDLIGNVQEAANNKEASDQVKEGKVAEFEAEASKPPRSAQRED